MTSRRWAGRITPAVVGAIVWVLFVAGGAFAFWTASGSGASHGSTGTLAALTLTPGTPVAALYPATSTAVKLTITNTNTSAVHVGSLALNTSSGAGGFAVDAGHSACAVSALSYTTQTNGSTGWTVPARSGGVNGTLAVTLTGALTMSTSAANACQGATFTVYLTAVG